MTMPVLFVGHGSPMNAIEDNEFRRVWQNLGRDLPRPRAILCISAHWETRGVYVTAAERPETIHDFYGFPPALFALDYPAPGDPALAGRLSRLVDAPAIHGDPARGLDHGAWSVLCAMYPRADIPVLQLSLDTAEDGDFHYRLGRTLAPLREEGVLVVGSGNIVHNLMRFRYGSAEPLDWALRFDAEVKERIRTRRHRDLIHWHTLAPDAHLAIPTPEHYLPLLYALGLQETGEELRFFNETVVSALSMTSVVIGESRV